MEEVPHPTKKSQLTSVVLYSFGLPDRWGCDR